MASKTAMTILLFTFISLAALFLILWLVDFSDFGIPEMIPGVNFRTYGILILVAFTLISFLLQKRLFKINPEISLFGLIAAPATVSFISFLVYQVIRQIIILGNSFSNKLSVILLSSIIPAILLTILASSYALRLKKITGIWSRIPFLLIVIIVLLTKKYITQFEW
jgi:hypothetical protein